MAVLHAQSRGRRACEIEAGLASRAQRLPHLREAPPRHSTLAGANALIDATDVRLTAASGWARFSAEACGANLHVIYGVAG
jgi:hypothetical protein